MPPCETQGCGWDIIWEFGAPPARGQQPVPAEPVQQPQVARSPYFRWYAINTYSGHENEVKANLEHRIDSMGQAGSFRRVVVPSKQVVETRGGQEVQTEKRIQPGYVLVNMKLNDDAWTVVKNTPGVTGFVGAGSEPMPISQGEIDRILHAATAGGERPRPGIEFSLGESVKVASGPLSDFDGEIVDVDPDQQKLKVLVDAFERQIPLELGFDQVKKLD
jgi:transcriptional antiterminator NusG